MTDAFNQIKEGLQEAIDVTDQHGVIHEYKGYVAHHDVTGRCISIINTSDAIIAEYVEGDDINKVFRELVDDYIDWSEQMRRGGYINE